MSRPVPTIAATSTLAMVRTAAARGIDVDALLREASLSLESLADPDTRLPAPAVLGLWNALRARSGDPGLQLVAPTALPFGAYRVIDYLVAASTTVGEGVGRFARYFGLIADSLALVVAEDREGHELVLSTADGGPVPPVYVDYVFAALVSRIRMRIRPALRVQRVELRQGEPAHAAVHRSVFDAPVRFGAAADLVRFTRAEWAAPTESGDAALAALLEEHARVLAERRPKEATGFTSDVRKAIAAGLPEAGAIDAVARRLNVSARTLQRRLVEGGTTFREVSEAVRARLAEGYLADPSVSIAEVTFLLGFSEESAFTRAFRRWTGESPGQWRRRRR